jgi:transcriptional regulator with XRE-family HTH domain
MIEAAQMRAARALLGWSQKQLVEMSGKSLATIQRMEDDTIGPGRSSAENVAAVQKALEAAGVLFIEANGEGVGVRLRKQQR